MAPSFLPRPFVMTFADLSGRSSLRSVLYGTPRVQTQEDAFAVLSNKGFFYVGGVMLQPQLVTGVYPTPDVPGSYTFERSGSADVVSDPSDPADLGELLFSVLLMAHGSALDVPWLDTRIVSHVPNPVVASGIGLVITDQARFDRATVLSVSVPGRRWGREVLRPRQCGK